jgi:hypothetical protein
LSVSILFVCLLCLFVCSGLPVMCGSAHDDNSLCMIHGITGDT